MEKDVKAAIKEVLGDRLFCNDDFNTEVNEMLVELGLDPTNATVKKCVRETELSLLTFLG
jgi:hypothetical protein